MVTTLGRGFVLGLAIAAPVGPIGVLCIRQTLAQGWWMGLATGLGAATADALYGCIAGLGLSALGGFLTDSQGLLHTVGGLFLCYLGVRTFQSSPTSNSLSSDSLSSDSLSSDSLSSDSLSSDSLSSDSLSSDSLSSDSLSSDSLSSDSLSSDSSSSDRLAPSAPLAASPSSDAKATIAPTPPSNTPKITLKKLLIAYGTTLLLTLTNPATILAFTAIFAGLGVVGTTAIAAPLALIGGIFLGSATWWLCLSGCTARLRHHFTPARLGWVNRISGVTIIAFGLVALGQ